MSIDIRRPSGMTAADATRWDEEVDGIKMMFEFELCHECGGDLDSHVISRGPVGNAFAWCKTGGAR